MTSNSSLLSNLYHPISSSFVIIANGSQLPIHGIQAVRVIDFTLPYVLYIPNFPFNLLSCATLSHLNYAVIFYPLHCVFPRKRKQLVREFEKNGLFYFWSLHKSSTVHTTVTTY